MKISGQVTRKKEILLDSGKTMWGYSIGQNAGFTTFDAEIAAEINEGDNVDCTYFVTEKGDATYKNIKTMTKKQTRQAILSTPQEPFNPQFWGMVFKEAVQCAIIVHEDGAEELTINSIKQWYNKLWPLAQKLRKEAQQ